MGALVLSSLFCLGFLLVDCKPLQAEPASFVQQVGPNYEYYSRPAKNFDQTKGISVEHSVTPVVLQTSATNYEPYNVKHYHFTAEDAVDRYGQPINEYNNGYMYQAVPEDDGVLQEFSSIETDGERYQDAEFQNEGQFLDTTGYKHYKTQTSFNLEGPRQLEQITTKSYHKEVEPYDIGGFQHEHKHQEHEEHGEIHYHQHKHLHKHTHKQEHLHKHKQEHKHEHGHKHNHKGHHDHHHEAKHHHSHQSHHKHGHKNEHHHKHHQDHKHNHHSDHKHDHHHTQEHKHDHHHGHKHSHHSDHKHSHHNDHKHDHHHDHSHHNDHKHKHSHQASHKHGHSHKHSHKHGHKSHHKHEHKYSKH